MKHKAMIDFTNENNEFMKFNGIRVTDLGENYAVTELTVTKGSLNPYGIIHGGALYTMADCAAGIAARGNGRRYVTLNGQLNYIKSVRSGVVTATGKIVHRGKSTCVVRVEIRDEKEALLSAGDFTMFCIGEDKNFQTSEN